MFATVLMHLVSKHVLFLPMTFTHFNLFLFDFVLLSIFFPLFFPHVFEQGKSIKLLQC